ncbi:thiaminase II [Staphylococcus simiae]|uniref:thiaminase II n=1 Tax=Staphylococcus simiae TaxID=308354 RepID=UPI001A97AE31|nr:thiaminase II [Staphylococcus simiae]MBO1199706.1 thiaminase II [Staphylococcus simiae]MBO1201993.1 thiaminase II [Staphylococcus simiae]MBO1204223.1 thiaminase II [Staphylococcus simiae]MBO1211728.1 thiaminase II [Staphylococcus simiae]MBO1230121.1 thiaminase II [Staphylococcus simiae]
MTLSQDLKQLAQPIIHDIYHDKFIQKLLKSEISKAVLRHYLQADAAYLKEFTNLYALLIPKMPSMTDVKFLVEQIEFMVDGEVSAHDILAQFIGEPYEDIIQQKVWPPSGDHYIKHMYFQAYSRENAVYTIAAMAPCPYVYAEIAKRALQDKHLNRESQTAQWFEFYNTEMDNIIDIFDQLIDRLSQTFSQTDIEQVKHVFLESCIHERNFFNMADTLEQWEFGGQYNE